MTNIEGTPRIENDLEGAQKRYDAAVNALEQAGAIKFAELIEAHDPVALEYLLALEGLNEALKANGADIE